MQEPQPADAVHDLGHYMRPLRRHKALIAVCVLVGTALGVLGANSIAPRYASTSKVLVLADITDEGSGNQVNGRTSGLVNLDTEAQIAKSDQVGTIVKQILNSPTSPATLTSRVSVKVPPNSTVMNLTYTARSAAAARAGAAAFANAYLENRTTVAKANLADQIASVNAQIARAEKQLERASQAVATTPSSSPEHSLAQQSQATAHSQISALTIHLNQLTTTPIMAGRVLLAATNGTRQWLQAALLIVSGFVLGLLVGIAAAYTRDRTGRLVGNGDDLADAGLVTLADNSGRSHSARRAGNGSTANAEDVAAAALLTTVGPAGVVYVTGVTSAAASARLCRRIANRLHQFGASALILAITPATGGNRESSRAFLTNLAGDDLTTPVLSVNGVNGAILRTVIAANKGRADFLVLVGSDPQRDSEAFILASAAQATVIVVEAGVSTRRGLRAVVDEISITPTTVVGAVLVRPDRRRATRSRESRRQRHAMAPIGTDTLNTSAATVLPASAAVLGGPPVFKE
jgi:capsular polysaccharide biosynthesis protein